MRETAPLVVGNVTGARHQLPSGLARTIGDNASNGEEKGWVGCQRITLTLRPPVMMEGADPRSGPSGGVCAPGVRVATFSRSPKWRPR